MIDFVGIVEYAFVVGPKKAARKLKKDFVVMAATEFERQVKQAFGPRPAPKPIHRKKPPEPERKSRSIPPDAVVLEAEIVDESEAPK